MKTLLFTIALLLNLYSSIDAYAQNGTNNSIELKIDGTEECPVFVWYNKKEVNTSYYQLEYSYNNTNFTPITTRKALGSSNFPTNYTFSGPCKMQESTIYYRVVLVLMGGERIISESKAAIIVDSTINQNAIANTNK